MRRRLLVREMVRVDDAGGGYTETPRDAGEWWADVEPLEGTELVEAMQVGMSRPHRFTGHYRASLTGAHELAFPDGRRFNIRSVVDKNAEHRTTVITADEEVAP